MIYNPKIDYLFCKYAVFTKPYKSEFRLKKVYNKVIKPNNRLETLMLKVKEIITIIPTLKFNSKSIMLIYKMLDKRLKRVVESKIVELLKINDIEILFRATINTPCFFHHNELMAKLIIYFKRIKQNKTPIIFYPRYTIDLIKEIQFSIYNKSLKELEAKTLVLNQKHRVISKEEIINLILQNKDYLMDYYKVTSLFIFGSYASNSYNEYSDLDIYLKDYKQPLNPIKEHLSCLTGLKVDVINHLFRKEIEKFILKII